MSHLPTEPSSTPAWIGFAIFVIVLCFFFPAILGLLIGMSIFLIPMFVVYKMLGGGGGFFK